MIAKKNKKANLERKRFAFFQIGLLISGSLCLAAFEYTTVKPDAYTHVYNNEEEVIIWEEPEEEQDFKFIEEQPQKTKVYLNDLSQVTIVEKIQKEGNPILTDHTDHINIEGDGDPDFSYINMGLEEEDGDKEWEIVEKEPEFPGGEEAMFEFIRNMISYPQLPKEMGIQGNVYVHFVVSKTGHITKVTSSGAPHDDLADEAERVVKGMPKWIPGEQAGKKVKVKYTLPIRFILG